MPKSERSAKGVNGAVAIRVLQFTIAALSIRTAGAQQQRQAFGGFRLKDYVSPAARRNRQSKKTATVYFHQRPHWPLALL